MNKKLNIFLLSFSMLYVSVFSSIAQVDPRLPYDLFKETNYTDAIPEFKKLLKIDPKDHKALFHIGLCYLRTNEDKGYAAGYFEKAEATGKADKDTPYYLAISYSHKYEYDKASEKMMEYLKLPGKFAEEGKKKLEEWIISEDLFNNPVKVKFVNLGEKVNSEYPDYAPFCSKDEQKLVFTTRRAEGKGKKEFDGFYPSDIFISKFDGLKFQNSKPISLNTNFDESCVGIHDDGSTMFLYFDNISSSGDIYYSEASGNNYSKKKKIAEGVNDEKSIETSASISSDLNTLFFASNREGGSGGLDIYMTRKLPNGKWAMPQNIKALNTDGNEDFPSLSPDGKTLYFSSNGHGGMGGYDLFKSTWNPETNEWTKPENLGYPINTSYDDQVICFTADDKHAYVSQVREEGYGDFDIYRITLLEEDITPAIYSITLKDETTSNVVEDCMIYIYDEYDDPVGEYKSKGGNPIFVALASGKYHLEIEGPGYELKEQTLKVSEFDNQKGIVKLIYKLSK